jgi:hypothetical protein
LQTIFKGCAFLCVQHKRLHIPFEMLAATNYTQMKKPNPFQPAWLDNPYLPQNTPKYTRLCASLWVLIGVLILMADGCAMAHFADSTVEAVIVAALTMPTGILVILAALEARK